MRAAKHILFLVLAAIVVGRILGYSFEVGEGRIAILGPSRVSLHNAEAEANSPACWGLMERFPKKDSLTREELDERSNAATACIKQKADYLISNGLD